MEKEGAKAPIPYFRFFLGLLDLPSRFVLTIRQMAVTIASSASERSLIISLSDSFIFVPPFYGYIIARFCVLVKQKVEYRRLFLLKFNLEIGERTYMAKELKPRKEQAALFGRLLPT